jgi:hypothetical protein
MEKILQQSAKAVLMVKPVQFGFNHQTAASNAFQKNINDLSIKEINNKAIAEFEEFKNQLEQKGVQVVCVNDTLEPATPDSIFPNNWISLDQHKRMVIYPMYAENRRLEKRTDIIEQLAADFNVETEFDYSENENDNIFLEGTGSMVIDYVNNVAYACLSPRTDRNLFIKYCEDMGYKPCFFNSIDAKGMDIYHTNVMMCIGTKVAVVCLDSITNLTQRSNVINNLEYSGHQIVDIKFKQMNNFAGNMLEVQNNNGEKFLVMSTRAKASLTEEQLNIIEKHNTILAANIPTIESVGGGGVRCMLAELF